LGISRFILTYDFGLVVNKGYYFYIYGFKNITVFKMIVSAKNQLKGKITRISGGAVNSEVIIELAPGIEITSIITKSSVENLKLSPGKEVYAVIKASNVMVGIEH
jgi:molybdopterin-binding protein